MIVTPALEISNAWRAAALPVGIGLMLVVAMLRLLRVCRLRDAALAIVGVALVVGAFWLAGPAARAARQGRTSSSSSSCWSRVNVFSGVPIAFSFALATFGYLALTTSTPMLVMVGRLDEGMSHLILLAVPLFIFLGALIEMTGMARAMIQFLASLLGHVRGGLSYVLIGAMYLVSGISGSKVADMAAIAPVLFPEMKKRGASARRPRRAARRPPARRPRPFRRRIVLITIGSVTGVSIAALFTGGMLPAVVLGVMLCAVVWWRYRNEDLSGVRRFARARDRPVPVRRAARAAAAVRDPRRGGRGRRHGHRGVDHRHRLLGAGRRCSSTGSSPGSGCCRCWSRPRRCRAPSSSSSAAPPRWRGASRSRASRRTWRS